MQMLNMQITTKGEQYLTGTVKWEQMGGAPTQSIREGFPKAVRQGEELETWRVRKENGQKERVWVWSVYGEGQEVGENTEEEERKQIHLKFTRSLHFYCYCLVQAIIIFSVDPAVTVLLVPQSPMLPPSNPLREGELTKWETIYQSSV